MSFLAIIQNCNIHKSLKKGLNNSHMFEIHHKLKEDLVYLGKLELSHLFMHPNSSNPWLVLVPEVPKIRELYELSHKEQEELLQEINHLSKFLTQEFKPSKLNIGALGNMVSQLHIHIICRYENDSAWPNAIWGSALDYSENKFLQIKNIITTNLSL